MALGQFLQNSGTEQKSPQTMFVILKHSFHRIKNFQKSRAMLRALGLTAWSVLRACATLFFRVS